jgi:SAM-dependent methyltransferase
VFLAQGVGGVVAFLILIPAIELSADSLLMALIQGAVASTVSRLRREPVWWAPIHLAFMPLTVLAQRLNLPPIFWLGGFSLLLLVFWRIDQSRVPLYLTNRMTSKAIAGQLPDRPCRVIDLGCGTGRVLRFLARHRPDCRFVGYEHAPLTFLWASLKCSGMPNVTIRLGSFWPHSLAEYDLVYAFLSPAPMSRLWEKACIEMDESACLISNSFVVPERDPQRILHVPDARKTLLFCYQPRSAVIREKKSHDCPAA